MWAKPLETSSFSSSESASNLKALFDFVRTSLTPAGSDSWKGPVLLVDDLSVLLSLGVTPVAVLDFIHYCRVAVCSQLKVLLPPRAASCTLHIQKILWSKAWLSFLFPPVHDEVLEGFGCPRNSNHCSRATLGELCLSLEYLCRVLCNWFPRRCCQRRALSVPDM